MRVTSMGMSVSSAGVAVEQAESQQVDQQPGRADPGDHLRALDLMGFGETLDSLQNDSEAQRRKEDGVDQSPHHLRPDPTEGVFVGGMGFLSKSYRDESHHQRNDIRQHMKGVRQH